MTRLLRLISLLLSGCASAAPLHNEGAVFNYVELTGEANSAFQINIKEKEWYWVGAGFDSTSFSLEFCRTSDDLICVYSGDIFGFAIPRDITRSPKEWSIGNFTFRVKEVFLSAGSEKIYLIDGFRAHERFAKFLYSQDRGLFAYIPLESAPNDEGGKGFVVRNIYYANGIGFGAAPAVDSE